MRRIHHVGTLGGDDYAFAVERAVRLTGKYLTTIPADEPQNWVIEPIKALGQRPEVLTLRAPRFHKDPMRPWHGAVYTAKPGQKITVETLGLTYAQQVADSWPVLRDLIHAYGTAWRMQLDIPGPFDRAAFAYGPFLPRHYDTEVEAASQQVNTVEAGRVPTIYHLSIPVETHIVTLVPAAATRLAVQLAEFVQRTTLGTVWILHLCAGDPNGKPLKDPAGRKPASRKTLSAMVTLANAIWQAWPSGYQLNAVHIPLGDGAHPAPAASGYYCPLYRLELPESVHISAGLASVRDTFAHQRTALQEAERAARRSLGVSTPCGLGRRPDDAEALLTRMVRLSEV